MKPTLEEFCNGGHYQAIDEWSGSCDPCDPANYWIDDVTGERINAATGERSSHVCAGAALVEGGQ